MHWGQLHAMTNRPSWAFPLRGVGIPEPAPSPAITSRNKGGRVPAGEARRPPYPTPCPGLEGEPAQEMGVGVPLL
jgi:hypothetical protein